MKFPPGYVPGMGTPKPVTSDFGERLLASMGWQRGQGLGKHQDGIKEAITVKNKQDTKGVGATTTSWDWSQRYWEDAFEGAAKNIKSSSSSSTATDASSSGYSSDDSDSSADTRRHRDGTQCTATQDELAIARQLAKDPWGRFGGKEGKMARIRRQEAALAGGVHTTPSMQPAPKPKVVKKKTKIPTTTTTKPVVIVIGDDKDDEAMDVDVPQRVVDGQWWGARYFAWGGLLGSSLRRTATRQRGFSERDQEVLYMQTQDGKVKGKQGLGRAGRAGELRGVAWKGSKVVFAEGPHKGIMWKAHVKRVLRQTKKRRMRTSKLAAAVMRALQAAGHNGDMDAGTVQSTMVRKIQRSKSFVCTDKHVALVECAP